ncbi:GIY-YIG nuclease family protein [Burkholderia ubonensis]|uniref:GIY-YIG nuclease family protein n=1 Tax=Burkholderia ubonensis TaxID=101571 RepID=UPI0009B40806|nr:GIY-YIG nuclease family protein [Burkholderia ubonensis]
MNQCNWGQLTFEIHAPTVSWNDVAGIYIFATRSQQQNQWIALYIGQAASLKDRLSNHERWDEARRLGATHVHVLVVPTQANRNSIEQSLIQTYQPRLNQQLK